MEDKSKKPSQARRAILRGSLAAPVVLTVPSASLATTTTLGRCLANLDKMPQPAFLVADTTPPVDTWMRIRIPVVRLVEPSGKVICEAAFKDDALAAPAFFRDVKTYAQVQFDTNQLKTFQAIATGDYVQALQWVDETSKEESTKVQISSPGSRFRHATGTCWSSFVKGA